MYQDGFRDSNGMIKMSVSRYMGNALIIITKCMIFRDGVSAKNNRFLNLGI